MFSLLLCANCQILAFTVRDVMIGISGYVILAIVTCVMAGIYHRSRTQHTAKMFRIIQEYRLRALNARISPHFLQNVFNFLANQYDKVDKDTIVHTLSGLATLLRKLIINIERRLIPLEDELEFTEQYLQLKKTVFFEKFVYTISIGEGVDAFGIDVPAMLLQPIVENSIKHGFRDIISGGVISISLRQAESYLICEIKDNGSGVQPGHGRPQSNGQSWLDMTKTRMGIAYTQYNNKPKVIVRSVEPKGQLTELYIPLR